MENPWSLLEEKIDHLEYENQLIEQEIRKKIQHSWSWVLKKRSQRFLNTLFQHDFLNSAHLDSFFAISYIDSMIGYGVFATKRIPALTYLGEYTGIVREKLDLSDVDNAYLFRYLKLGWNRKLVIDAQKKGNFTRFINHSETPNLLSGGIVVDQIYHIIFYSNRLIETGEQLTYNYGEDYWKKKPNPFQLSGSNPERLNVPPL